MIIRVLVLCFGLLAALFQNVQAEVLDTVDGTEPAAPVPNADGTIGVSPEQTIKDLNKQCANQLTACSKDTTVSCTGCMKKMADISISPAFGEPDMTPTCPEFAKMFYDAGLIQTECDLYTPSPFVNLVSCALQGNLGCKTFE